MAFLRWALPRLRLQWAGFRKVRGQVCKRIDRRLRELGLARVEEYRGYVETHPAEWVVLDTLCWISISRFYRDRSVFQCLEREIFPQLAEMAAARSEGEVRCWSIGCAAGEEPYTVAIVWKLGVGLRFPALGIRVLGADADAHAIERAREARYVASSLKDLPEEWRAEAFLATAAGSSLKPGFREAVTLLRQDIREAAPGEVFHCVLCRYLVFTYFEEGLQGEILERIKDRMVPGGALVLGRRERLPAGVSGFDAWSRSLGIYRRLPGS